MRNTVGILGTPIDVLNATEVLSRIEQFISSGRFHQVATANTDFLVNALDDPELMRIMHGADLVIPDGMPLIWASRLVQSPLPERVTGADLVPSLASLAAKQGYTVFMLGARPEVAEEAKHRMLVANPGLQIVGCYSPPVAPLPEMDHESIVRKINEAGPDILLVAFGNPKQEKWIHQNRCALAKVPVCIGIGGTFDFVAGQTRRAPQWLQTIGLEWLYRMAQDPQRLFRRYANDIVRFVPGIAKQWMSLRSLTRLGQTELRVKHDAGEVVVSVVGDLVSTKVSDLDVFVQSSLAEHLSMVIDLKQLGALDGAALGAISLWSSQFNSVGLRLRLVSVSVKAMRALRTCHVDNIEVSSMTVIDAVRPTSPSGLS